MFTTPTCFDNYCLDPSVSIVTCLDDLGAIEQCVTFVEIGGIHFVTLGGGDGGLGDRNTLTLLEVGGAGVGWGGGGVGGREVSDHRNIIIN